MKTCKVPNCNGKHKCLGYCEKHYCQYRKYGKIIDDELKKPKNEIIKYDDYAEVILKNKDEEVGRVIIDLEDVELVSKNKWYMNNTGYAYNRKIGLMHRLITSCPSDKVVDHMNHNKLDNRKNNLRICTVAENNRNKNKRNNTLSQYKGVSWDKKKKTWCAQIKINNKAKHIGYYDNELEASIAYDKASILYHSVYAKINHPIENYVVYIIKLGLDPKDFGINESNKNI